MDNLRKTWIFIFFLLFSFLGVLNVPHVYAAASITYDSVANIITVQGGSGDGDSWATALGFWDLWNASNVNGWNVVDMFQTDNVTFEFGCRIVIAGSVHTYFWSRNEQVVFNSTAVSANAQYLIEVKYRGHLRLGQLDDATDKLTSNGTQITAVDSGHDYISIIYGQHSTADIQLYSSSFISTSPQGSKSHQIRSLRNNAPVYNCLFDNVQFNTGSIDGYRITMIKGYNPLSRSTGTFDDIYLQQPDGYYAYWYKAETGHLKNVKGIGHTGAYGSIRAYQITVDHNITNGDLDAWTFNWGSPSTGKVYRNYEFDATFTYENGTAINGTATGARAVIQHYGQGGAVDYNATLGEDGTIPTQTLSMGFYNETGGNTIYSYNPYNLQLYNVSGYQVYSKNFTLSEKTAWEIALSETATTVADFDYVTPVVMLSAIPFGVGFIVLILRRREEAPAI